MKINSQNNFAEEKDKENNRKIIGKIIGVGKRLKINGRLIFPRLFLARMKRQRKKKWAKNNTSAPPFIFGRFTASAGIIFPVLHFQTNNGREREK